MADAAAAAAAAPEVYAAAEAEEKMPEIRLALCKGRMKDGVFKLFADAGIKITLGNERAYRPTVSWGNFDAKLLKPQNILGMLVQGSRDVGFGGHDWVLELDLEGKVVEIMDTKMDPVRIVAAAPDPDVLKSGVGRGGRKLIIASEYSTITQKWIKEKGLDATFLRTWGATESLPPEDADIIVDNTATGSTLKANGLHIVDTILTSSTRMFASKAAMADEGKRAEIEKLVMLLESVKAARERKMVTFNLLKGHDIDSVIEKLPCARMPTVSELYHGGGYAVQVAVHSKLVPSLVPLIKSWGGTDVIVTAISQLVS